MKKHQESGQSTIEFIFTFAFGVSLIFMIFNSAMNYTAGYLVHYANFMASRTYLTSEGYSGQYGNTEGMAQVGETDAEDVFRRYRLEIFSLKDMEFHLNRPVNDPASYLTVGTYVLFSQKIDALGKITGQQKLEMVSESFLGKEPPRVECATRICKAMIGTGNCSSSGLDITLFDDGC